MLYILQTILKVDLGELSGYIGPQRSGGPFLHEHDASGRIDLNKINQQRLKREAAISINTKVQKDEHYFRNGESNPGHPRTEPSVLRGGYPNH